MNLLKSKAALTALFLLFFHFVVPLAWKPELILSAQILVLMAGTLFLILTQPRLSVSEMQAHRESDKGTTLLIIAFASIGIIGSVLEWAIFRNNIWTWNLLSLSGFLLMIAGLGFRVYVIQILGRNFSATVQIKKEQELITEGPYKHLRHPSYTGAWIFFIGFGFFLQAFLGSIILSLGLLFAYQRRIQAEEDTLIKTFGKLYRKYQSETHRMIPGLW